MADLRPPSASRSGSRRAARVPPRWPPRSTCRSSRARRAGSSPRSAKLSLDAFAAAAPGEGDASAVDRVQTLLEAPEGAVTLGQVDGRVLETPGRRRGRPGRAAADARRRAPPRAGRAAPRHARRGRPDVFTAANDAAWTGGAFVYVPRGVRVDAPILLTAIADAAGTRAAPPHADRARGGRRGRGLGAVPVRLRGRRVAAQHRRRARRRPERAPALRLRPGHEREVVDLRHPARRGRPRRPPRLGRARLRLGARQGAHGHAAGRRGRRTPRSPAPTRRTRASTSTSTPRRSTAPPTPRRTSRSAASSPTARRRSGAG